MKTEKKLYTDKKIIVVIIVIMFLIMLSVNQLISNYSHKREAYVEAENQINTWESLYKEYSEYDSDGKDDALRALLVQMQIHSQTYEYSFTDDQLDRITDIEDSIEKELEKHSDSD